MLRLATLALLGIAAVTVPPAWSQTQPPPFATTKVDGTDNVYIFRAGNHQAMFVVTSAGVIATDPIGYVRRDAPATYLAEIRKVTNQPVKYVIYSHHHYDHIAGGKVFKDAGATFIAHKRAKERLAQLKDPDTVLPDQTLQRQRTITLGGTSVELKYVGLNHSDSTLVMRLPKEKIIFAVDFIPVASMPGRGMIDSYPIEWEDSLKKVLAMDWNRLIPGHPGPGGRLGTKDDVRALLTMMQDMSEEVKVAARAGKCWDTAEREVKLEKYKNVAGYEPSLPMIVRRYCGLWGRGT
ncbi:MAG: MBL fold metallo-hydrolase [Alphaproteobacteria bacterium]|nr:MBL fold metallo-hydrolase [Alphaproteobacteria bacterium]